MPSSPEPEALRRRAAVLRALARRIGSLRVLDLHRAAGPDTWVGPSAQHCLDELIAQRARLLDAADRLRVTAARFERAAADLEARSTALPGVR